MDGRELRSSELISRLDLPYQRYCSWAHTDDDDGDGVTPHGGHTPANRLTETYNLGL